jgi:hypothetical protein
MSYETYRALLELVDDLAIFGEVQERDRATESAAGISLEEAAEQLHTPPRCGIDQTAARSRITTL